MSFPAKFVGSIAKFAQFALAFLDFGKRLERKKMITIRCVPFSDDVHPESDCNKVGGFSASRMAAVTTSRNTIATPQHKREFKQRRF